MIPKEYQQLRRLFSRQEKVKLAGLLLMMLLAAALEVVGIGMVPAFVAVVAEPGRVLDNEKLAPFLETFGITDAAGLMVWGAIALFSIFALKNVYVIWFRYVEARFLYARLYALNHRLIKAYMGAPYAMFLRRNTAELLRNVTEEITRLINQVLNPMLKIASDGLMTISVLLLLLVLEPIITLFVFLGIGGGAVAFLLITQRRMKAYGKKAQACRTEMLKTASQAFGGIKEARIMSREPFFIEQFRSVAYDTSQYQRRKVFLSELPKPILETTAVAGVLGIALVMHLQGKQVAEIVPVIALFGVATVRLMPSGQRMTKMLTNLFYSIASVKPVHDDLMELERPTAASAAEGPGEERIPLRESISLRSLHYTYRGSEDPALQGVDLRIERGQSVAFVGPSGAGKTTIIDVLLGLLVPDQGGVLVDERNIQDNLPGWQLNIGYIPQFIYLSDDTIRRNIAFGLEDEQVEESQILRAVEQAQLTELIASLPEGLDTIIGERGTRLSGGQRQRIGIARALYHDPEVLVMDEATSALDSVTEQQIMSSVDALKGDRTIIIIAHRLSTVMDCSVLHLMVDGKLADHGTYAELLERNESFRQMARGA